MGSGFGNIRPSSTASTAEVQAILGLSVGNVEEGLQRVQTSFGRTQAVIAGFIGVISFTRIINQITDLAAEAVKFERVKAGFESLTTFLGVSSDKIIADIQRITRHQI